MQTKRNHKKAQKITPYQRKLEGKRKGGWVPCKNQPKLSLNREPTCPKKESEEPCNEKRGNLR